MHAGMQTQLLSCVRISVTPWTAAYQAPLSMGFSQARIQEWVAISFSNQCMTGKSESEVAQSCPTLCDPIDCSPPGSSVHGIFPGKSTGVGDHCLLQAR